MIYKTHKPPPEGWHSADRYARRSFRRMPSIKVKPRTRFGVSFLSAT